eukprot:3107925-Pyramimonas_sp.AAC.1
MASRRLLLAPLEETVHGPSSACLGLQQGAGQGCPIYSEDAVPLRRCSSNCTRYVPSKSWPPP